MSQTAPLFHVALDASELPWAESYAAIYAQVFYRGAPFGKLFAADLLLSEDHPKGVIRADMIRRAITDPYEIFFIYLIYRPGTDRAAVKAQVLKALAHVPKHGPNAEATALAEIKRVLNRLPLDVFVGPVQTIDQTSVVVPPALATAKLQLEFIADTVIDGNPVHAEFVRATITLRSRTDSPATAITPRISLPDFGHPKLYVLTPTHHEVLVETYRDERSFVLDVEISYKIDAGKHSDRWITRPRQTVSPMIPALYLRPDLDIYTLTYDGSQIDWQGADPVVLVLVNAELNVAPSTPGAAALPDKGFTTVTLDPAGPFELLRSINLPADEVPTISWTASYYYQSGRVENVGNPQGQPLTGRTLVLPPNASAVPGPGMSAFVVNPVEEVGA